MITTLTESWAGIYLQVAATILVFALGIPLIVERISIPEDLRQIIHRHRNPNTVFLLIFVLVTLIALCFIWALHPIETSFAKHFHNNPEFIFTQAYNIAASVLISLVLLTPLLLLRLTQSIYSKENILSHLEHECERHIHRKGNIDEQALEDIKHLGEQSNTRNEKIKVLMALERLAIEVQTHERYEGKGLEDVIGSIEVTLRSNADITSLIDGIQTFQRINFNSQKSGLNSTADIGLVLRTLQRLAIIACKMDNDQPAIMILDLIESIGNESDNAFIDPAALALFELGKVALEHKRFLVSWEALKKLEMLASVKQPFDSKNSAAYLGLIAHFYDEKGAALQRAKSSLKGVVFEPSLQQCLLDAKEFHYSAARFDTVDKLDEMISNNKRKPKNGR